MMFLTAPKDLIATARRDAIEGPQDLPTGLTENAAAAFELFRSEESSDSKRRHLEDQLDKRAEMIRERLGHVPAEYRSFYGNSFMDLEQARAKIDAGDQRFLQEKPRLVRAVRMMDKLREQYPELPTEDDLFAAIPGAAAVVRERVAPILARAQGWGRVGQVAGTLGGAMVDPLNLASMVVAGPAVVGNATGILARTLRAAKIGAAFGAGTETAIQPFVYDFKQEIGVDYTVGDALTNIGAAAAGGALFLGVGVNVPPLARSSMRALSDSYRKLVKQRPHLATRDGEAAARVIEDFADLAEANPLPKTPDGQAAHFEAVDQAMRDLAEGRMADVADRTAPHEPPVPSPVPRVLADDDPRLVPTHTINTPEREAFRARMVEETLVDAVPVAGRKPIAYLMGGGGGSGKGTVLRKLREQGVIPERGAVHIDPDRYTEANDVFKAIAAAGDGRGAPVVRKESGMIANRAQEAAIKRQADLIIDKTLGNPEKALAMIRALKDAGYEVRLFGVASDIGQAASRAVARASGNGRWVPFEVLAEDHRGFARGFEAYADEADRAILLDNTSKTKQLAFKRQGGKLEISDHFGYTQFVNRRNPDGTIPQEIPGNTRTRLGRDAREDRARPELSGRERDRQGAEGGGRAEASPGADDLAGELRRLESDGGKPADDPLLPEITAAEQAEVDAALARLGDELEVPVALRLEGNRTQIVTRPARELLSELDEQQSTLSKILDCVLGGVRGAAA